MRNILRPTLVLALLLATGLATVGPLRAEEGAATPAARETAAAGQVNVNSATPEELAMLPHVGPSVNSSGACEESPPTIQKGSPEDANPDQG